MGFIHEVESDILGIEERSESIYLHDDSEDGKHMFFHHERPDTVRDRICIALMDKAGVAFAHDDEAEAKRLKKCAEEVGGIELTEPRVASIEVTKLWLQDLYNFISSHKTVLEE